MPFVDQRVRLDMLSTLTGGLRLCFALSHLLLVAVLVTNLFDLLGVVDFDFLHQLPVNLDETFVNVLLHLHLDVFNTLFMLELYDLLQVLYLSLEVATSTN